MFRLPIFLIALLHKPQRSHRYACVCEAALSEKYSASNYPKLNFRYTSVLAEYNPVSTLEWFDNIEECVESFKELNIF